MKAIQIELCAMGEMKRDFSLECTSVGQNCILIQCIFSCAINMCVFRQGFMWTCHSLMTLLFPPASEVWEWECQMPVKASLVHFSSSHTVCNQRQRGHAAAITAPHNRARYKDVTFLWFFKAFNGNDFFFRFAFRVPYIYACFYNVSFNILMYIL